MEPRQLPDGRVGADVALEVDVVALLDVARLQRAAQPQPDYWRICVNRSYIRTTVQTSYS